ncbi:MAG: hypothetical protein NTZ49_01055 [Candidatus Parcubacteria bacterium]|nr:hypothetical protein [Candidatus Parcubacteria bacterium]
MPNSENQSWSQKDQEKSKNEKKGKTDNSSRGEEKLYPTGRYMGVKEKSNGEIDYSSAVEIMSTEKEIKEYNERKYQEAKKSLDKALGNFNPEIIGLFKNLVNEQEQETKDEKESIKLSSLSYTLDLIRSLKVLKDKEKIFDQFGRRRLGDLFNASEALSSINMDSVDVSKINFNIPPDIKNLDENTINEYKKFTLKNTILAPLVDDVKDTIYYYGKMNFPEDVKKQLDEKSKTERYLQVKKRKENLKLDELKLTERINASKTKKREDAAQEHARYLEKVRKEIELTPIIINKLLELRTREQNKVQKSEIYEFMYIPIIDALKSAHGQDWDLAKRLIELKESFNSLSKKKISEGKLKKQAETEVIDELYKSLSEKELEAIKERMESEKKRQVALKASGKKPARSFILEPKNCLLELIHEL